MDEILYLSSREAARLLQVHESSVKRWCNTDELPCTYTAGGHRRIALGTLLDLARARSLSCHLIDLQPFEVQIWQGIQDVQHGRGHDRLVGLAYQWLQEEGRGRVLTLLRLLLQQHIGYAVLFDHVLRPVLVRVGTDWHAGRIRIGDEHRIIEAIRDILYTLLADLEQRVSHGSDPPETAIVGCSWAGQHDIGALMVRILLVEQGWRVVYLGRNVPTEEFARQQARFDASMVCVSFSPPQALPDALELVRTLSHHYEPDQPYRLVLGGEHLNMEAYISLEALPFLSLAHYSDTQSFLIGLKAYTTQ